MQLACAQAESVGRRRDRPARTQGRHDLPQQRVGIGDSRPVQCHLLQRGHRVGGRGDPRGAAPDLRGRPQVRQVDAQVAQFVGGYAEGRRPRAGVEADARPVPGRALGLGVGPGDEQSPLGAKAGPYSRREARTPPWNRTCHGTTRRRPPTGKAAPRTCTSGYAARVRCSCGLTPYTRLKALDRANALP